MLEVSSWSFRQSEGDNRGAGPGFQILTAAGADRDELSTADAISDRRRVAAGGQRGLPQQLAGAFIVGVKLSVERRCTDEQQSPAVTTAPP